MSAPSDKPAKSIYNKAALVQDFFAKGEGVASLSQAKRNVETLTNLIVAGLKKHKTVVLSELGSFEIRARAARKGRNPATGATIKIPAKNVIRFKPRGAAKALCEKKGSK